MDKTSHQEKIELEHQAAKLFLRLYEHHFNIPMRHIWHNQPSKPDVSCYQAQTQLDLEIAHLYGSEKEAMAILGRELSDETKLSLQSLLLEPIEQRLSFALNKILINKAKKHYNSARVWLVIRNANPFWHCDDIKAIQPELTINEGHPFEQIWIIGDIQGTSGMICLYDKKVHQTDP